MAQPPPPHINIDKVYIVTAGEGKWYSIALTVRGMACAQNWRRLFCGIYLCIYITETQIKAKVSFAHC